MVCANVGARKRALFTCVAGRAQRGGTADMGLLSSFKRAPGATPATVDDPQAVEAARVRARRRLIGAVVLLGVGVIAFPLLFETQPRPIPVDIAIEIPRKETAPPLVLPPVASPAAAATPRPEPAAAAPKPEVAVESKPEPTPEPKPEPKPAVQAATAQPLPSKAAASSADAATGRFVVQVGAFADAAGARGARAKVELLGLRTYTQAVETSNGPRTRVRVGPFAARDEADKAAAKLKAAGLPAAVLTL